MNKSLPSRLLKSIIIVFLTALLSSQTFCQNFKPQSLITIPGKNTNVDYIGASAYSEKPDTYICWQNEVDSTYNIYLKRIAPFDSNNVLMFSSRYLSIRPSVGLLQDSLIRIAWQSWINNHWQIKSVTYKNGSIGKIINVTDSVSSNTNPKISRSQITWIKDSSLVFADFDSVLSKPVVIDTGDCSNPDLSKVYGNIVAYEKGKMQNKQIRVAERVFFPADSWSISQLTNGGYNISPRFGPDRALSFSSLIGNVWRTISKVYLNTSNLDTSKNVSCNYYNPEYLTYAIPTAPAQKQSSFPNDGFFMIFDSDSILTNREVFIQYTRNYNPYLYSQAINISNMPGDDIKPRVFFTTFNDSSYIRIIWEHYEGDNVQLWTAINKFNRPHGDVKDDPANQIQYSLSQNYPNPFNPSTKIRFTIPLLSHVKLQIFDLLGKEIVALVDELKPQGSYEVEVNAAEYKLSSGMYFYRIQAGKYLETKKLIYLK